MTKEKLTNDILATIAERKKFAKRDFKTSEILLTISIVGCFITATLATLAGNHNIDNNVIAILGGLSGIVIAYYQRFSFTKRLIWNELYCSDLQRLLNELEVAEPLIVAEKYTALQEKKESAWATKKFEF